MCGLLDTVRSPPKDWITSILTLFKNEEEDTVAPTSSVAQLVTRSASHCSPPWTRLDRSQARPPKSREPWSSHKMPLSSLCEDSGLTSSPVHLRLSRSLKWSLFLFVCFLWLIRHLKIDYFTVCLFWQTKFFFLSFCLFLGPHPWHMEIPRLGV